MPIRVCILLRFLGLALLLPTAACGTGQESGPGPVVLAASSLQEALTEVGAAWEAQGHAGPVLSFAASSALSRQVEQGAPADLFISADEGWMDTLEAQDLLQPGTRADLLGNRLVVIVPAGSAAKRLADLGEGRLALADPDAVPAGRYARAALERLGLWTKMADNVVPAENVRAALVLVERGEADIGIVYATDARASAAVEVVEQLPRASHPPIRYPVAVLRSSTHAETAALRAFLASGEARAIFARHGFEPVR